MNEGSSRSHSLFIMTITLANSLDLSVFIYHYIYNYIIIFIKLDKKWQISNS